MANFVTPTDARAHFITVGNPYFYILGKKDAIYYRNEKEEDLHTASDLLHDYLERNQDKSEISIFTFPELPKSGKVVQCKKEDGECFTYQRQFTIPEKQEFYGSANMMMQTMMRKLEESERKRDQQMEMMMALINSEDDEEVEEKADPNSIAGLIANPQVMNIMSTLIMNIFGNASANKPVAMAGTGTPVQPNKEVTQEELFSLVNQILAKGVTPDHLRKLIAMDDAKFTMILGML